MPMLPGGPKRIKFVLKYQPTLSNAMTETHSLLITQNESLVIGMQGITCKHHETSLFWVFQQL